MTFVKGLTAASVPLALIGALSLTLSYTRAHAEIHRPVLMAMNASSNQDFGSDEVSNEGASALPRGAQVRMEITRTSLPFSVTYLRTMHLLPGHRETWIPGTPGLRQQFVEVTSVNGHDVSHRVTNSRIVRHSVSRVILVGTDPFSASRSMGSPRHIFTMIASKYDVYLGGAGTGYTRTGVHARRGIIAVDPRVIPLGTHLYVEGYGYCVAADTGGAIKGRRIDLCVESTREADDYGIHRVRVCIIP